MSSIQRETIIECDVLVAGGGPAGVPAAIAAARCGARTVLCQDRSVLGGNASSEVRMHIMGADNGGGRGVELATEAREGGIIEEVRLALAVGNPQRSAAMLDLVLYDLCRAEANLTLLTDTPVVGVRMADGRIAEAIADRQLTEERCIIRARQYIDCTGDGRLGAEAGAPFRWGREAASAFGETLAPPEADRKTLGSTILFTARRHDRPMPFTAPSWARRFDADFFRLRPFAGTGTDRGYEYGYWWCEWGGELDTIADQPRIRDELLAVVMGIWDHIKNCDAGRAAAEHWALDWFGFLPGKRESRRFIGQTTMTERDVLAPQAQPDAIAYGGWGIDIHPPEGIDRPDLPPYTKTHAPYLYDIPLRSCVSSVVPNLLFAGRNHSATHVAFASNRVMATCAVMGQGVGTAAAYACARGIDAAAIAGDARRVHAVQQRLLADDCYLIGVAADDRRDAAPLARIAADSARPGAGPEQVVSGQTRSVHGPQGADPARSRPGLHRWMSASLPATLSLQWDAPVDVGLVELVFDTGLHRLLTLSQSDGAMHRQVWGRPQPETVSDYRIEILVDGQWSEVHRIAGNWLRVRRHAVGRRADGLRLVVTATHGVDHARVCALRVLPSDASPWIDG